jgi:hypothetical protein
MRLRARTGGRKQRGLPRASLASHDQRSATIVDSVNQAIENAYLALTA